MNTHRWKGLAVALILLAGAPCASGQSAVAESQAHIQTAIRAWQEGDFATAAKELEAARALNPASLFTRYSLARCYAKLERNADALSLLEGLAAQGIDMGVAEQADFEPLIDDARFQAMLATLAETTSLQDASEAHFEFPLHGVIPEGIAADPDSGRLFFGSMRNGDVYALDAELRVSRFGSIDAPGFSAIGLTVDRERNVLWVAGAAFRMAEGFDPQASVGSGLFGIDLTSGERVREARWLGADSNFNDVTVAPDGTVYASGSGLYKLVTEPDRIEPVVLDTDIVGGNGLVVHPDGKTLFLSSYPVGLFSIDLEQGSAQLMTGPDDLSLYGVDGLYWHNNGLVAIQNGARPWRMLQLKLDRSRRRVTAAGVFERGSPATTPMTGAIVGDTIYYVGEGEQPANLPSQLPDFLEGNVGTVVIRRTSITQEAMRDR